MQTREKSTCIQDADTASILSDDEDTPFQIRPAHKSRRSLSRLFFTLLILGNILFCALYINLSIRHAQVTSELSNIQPEFFPSLEKSKSTAYRKENRVFPLTVAGTPFAGVPSQELDRAWHELLADTVIRVSKEDLDYYNVTSLPLADGSGYASEIFMTHEIHCLKKIRQWIYKETYFEHVQGFARNELERHVNHCIETLRQGILCRGDVSLGTYTYLSGSSEVTARSWASHQCVDAEALLSWTKARAIDMTAPGLLVRPEDVGPEHITTKKVPH
ncbi:hypothetical protein ACN47E_008716 [Coniothyrium glycines]